MEDLPGLACKFRKSTQVHAFQEQPLRIWPEDFVKPLLRKKPDNVVLHIRTNDLNTQEPRLTAEGIVNLAFQIEGDAPETNLALSGLIARADDKDGKV